jgi:hypothetical protein
MITPDKPEPGATPAAAELSVPLAALAIDGTAPAAGDETEVPARLTLTRIDGDRAVFTVAAVNGEPVTAAKAAPAPDDMLAMAEEADAEMEE